MSGMGEEPVLPWRDEQKELAERTQIRLPSCAELIASTECSSYNATPDALSVWPSWHTPPSVAGSSRLPLTSADPRLDSQIQWPHSSPYTRGTKRGYPDDDDASGRTMRVNGSSGMREDGRVPQRRRLVHETGRRKRVDVDIPPVYK